MKLEPGSRIYGTFDHEGRVATVTNMFDIDGDATGDTALAIIFVAFLSENEWLSLPAYGVQLRKLS